MSDQSHSHPILRRQTVEKQTESKQPEDIVPTSEHPVTVPSFVSHDVAVERERRTSIQIEYADETTLQERQATCNNIADKYPHKAVLYIGSEYYDHTTITILQGLQQLGFTVYTLKKPNVNSWFCNQIIENTAGLKLDFVLSNVGWGTRWSYYSRYRLNRFPKVLINGLGDSLTWEEQIDNIAADMSTMKIPENADMLRIQPHPWSDKIGKYAPDIVFSPWPIGNEIDIPLGIHADSLEMHVGWMTIDRTNDIISLSTVQQSGEITIDPEVAQMTGKDPSMIHGWHYWIKWGNYYQVLNEVNMVRCGGDYGDTLAEPYLWQAMACGALPLVVIPEDYPHQDYAYPLSVISPFTVCKSEQELEDKYDWLVEHPRLLDNLRRDCTRLAHKYFTPTPITERFLYAIHDVLGD